MRLLYGYSNIVKSDFLIQLASNLYNFCFCISFEDSFKKTNEVLEDFYNTITGLNLRCFLDLTLNNKNT